MGASLYFVAKHVLIIMFGLIVQIPVSRPCQWREANKRVQRGGPTTIASGTYTQAYGSIKQTDLQRLTHVQKKNNW